MTPEWILAICAALTLVGALIAVMWKFSKSIDRNTQVTQQIVDVQKSQWNRIDEIACVQESHGTRLVKIETRLDYASGAHS